MSALMTPRRTRNGRRTRSVPAPGGQPALFGAGSTAVAAPAAPAPAVAEPPAPAVPEPAAPAGAVPPATAAAPATGAVIDTIAEPTSDAAPESATTARAHRHGPTLDDLVAGAWEGLLAGAPADCFVCGAPLAPRHSAGAGVVGGRCSGCGTTVS